MKVWAYEVCFCQYETGYQVKKLFATEELAKAYSVLSEVVEDRDWYDGWRIVEWRVQEAIGSEGEL